MKKNIVIGILILFSWNLYSMTYQSYSSKIPEIQNWYEFNYPDGEAILKSESIVERFGDYHFLSINKVQSDMVRYQVFMYVGDHKNQKYIIEEGYVGIVGDGNYSLKLTIDPDGRFNQPTIFYDGVYEADFFPELCNPYSSEYTQVNGTYYIPFSDGVLKGAPVEWAFLYLTHYYYLHKALRN